MIYFTGLSSQRRSEAAALAILCIGDMPGIDITKQFEEECAAWQGSRYALAHGSGFRDSYKHRMHQLSSVVENYEKMLPGDRQQWDKEAGGWTLTRRKGREKFAALCAL